MNKPDRYLPMREGEFVALLSMADEINKQIKKTSKIAKKERRHSDDESNRNFIQVPLPRTQKKRPNKRPAPSSDSNDEEAVKGSSMGKGGVKKLKLVEKRKAKKMEKENDLVESSQGSDSQLSEAENK